MKAYDIRKATFEAYTYYDNAIKPSPAECFMGAMLQEIAAQLADLNEHFRMVDAAVFGAKK